MRQLLTEILTFKTSAFVLTRRIYKNNEQSKNEPCAKTIAIIADKYITDRINFLPKCNKLSYLADFFLFHFDDSIDPDFIFSL